MSDEIDRATDQWEVYASALIQNAGWHGLECQPTGSCLNCGELVQQGHRWCDHDCLIDWQRRAKHVK